MDDPTLSTRIGAAEAYEQLMVPALFADWAPKVVGAAGITSGQRVLDLACGTGVLAREARQHVGEDGSVTGVDPNPGMLAVARRLLPDADWREATAESLPFADRAFDAVVSQFGLMFFSDRRSALVETARVLEPHGRYAFAVWDSLAANPAYDIEIAIIEDISGRRAADLIRAPFALGDREGLGALFHDAGLNRTSIMTLPGAGRFPGVQALVEADLRGWLAFAGVVLSEEEIAEILREAERRLSKYVRSGGGVVFPTSAHIAFGTIA